MAQNNQKKEESATDRTSRWKSLLSMFLKILIAAGIISFLVWKSGNIEGISKLKLSDLNLRWLGAACMLYTVHLFVNAWRWRLLLKYRNLPCSLGEAFSLTWQSFFFSLAMPGGAIGGDVIRAGFLAARFPKGAKFDGVFTILMDRFTGMIGIFLTAFMMLPWVLTSFPENDPAARSFSILLLAGSAAGLAASVFVFGHRWLERWALIRKLEAIGDRLTRGFSTELLQTLDAYHGAVKEIIICILASVIGVNLTLGLCFYCVCLSCDAAVFAPLFFASIGAITIGNIAGLLPATPSGVGMRDYFVLSLLGGAMARAGIEYEAGAIVPTLLMTLVIIGMGLLGGIFFLFDRSKKKEKSCT